MPYKTKNLLIAAHLITASILASKYLHMLPHATPFIEKEHNMFLFTLSPWKRVVACSKSLYFMLIS